MGRLSASSRLAMFTVLPITAYSSRLAPISPRTTGPACSPKPARMAGWPAAVRVAFQSSMAAAIALLGASAPAGEGRRIAVLGDMLELGADEATFHADLVGPLGGAKVDQVFAAGERMRHLWNALPGQQQGAYAANASEIAAKLLEDLRDGDIILVKGSNASKVSDVISILEKECETG